MNYLSCVDKTTKTGKIGVTYSLYYYTPELISQMHPANLTEYAQSFRAFNEVVAGQFCWLVYHLWPVSFTSLSQKGLPPLVKSADEKLFNY